MLVPMYYNTNSFFTRSNYLQIQFLPKNYLGMVPVFPDMPSYLVLGSFPINIFSTALLLPALIVLRALANILE